MKNEDLEKIAERHAGIVTPPLFDLGAQSSVSYAQLVQLSEAVGLDPGTVLQACVDSTGIRAEVLHDGQAAWQFWPAL